MQYTSLLSGADLQPLLRVVKKNPNSPTEIVGGFVRYGQGLIIALPHANHRLYFRELLKLPELLSKSSTVALPDWTAVFRTVLETSAITNKAELNAQIDGIQKQIDKHDETIAIDRKLMRLVASSGDDFADAVADALREVGLKVVEGPHPRADFISHTDSRFIAIEAKGLDGGAKEIQARQVVTWRSEVDTASVASDDDLNDQDVAKYAHLLDQLMPRTSASDECKGVLIVGTFRKQPLSQRDPNQDFPDTVKRFLERERICALTGLQLLGLVLEARSEPRRKPLITEALCSTNGIFADHKDWTAFLKEMPDGERGRQ
jgi:hypothetical protein